MSTAKPRAATRKVAKASAAAGKSAARVSSPKAAVPVVIGRSGRGSALRDVAVSEKLRLALGELVTVSIADARTMMPKMVRSSATGHVYLIGNARTADAPAAILIGVEELGRVVAEPVATRTLGELLATLPFSGMALSPPKAPALPGPGLPTALGPA
jgi:hypothetical protein